MRYSFGVKYPKAIERILKDERRSEELARKILSLRKNEERLLCEGKIPEESFDGLKVFSSNTRGGKESRQED